MVVDELYLARSAGRSMLERFGVPERWSRMTVAVGVVAAMTLIVEGVPAAATPAPTPFARAAAQPAQGPDLSGPAVAADAITAAVQARAQGRAVEDLSQRTMESSTFAMPDGTWATGVGSGPVWVPRMEVTGGDGTAPEDWAPVNLTLQLDEDGLVRPVAQVADLVLSGGTVSPEGVHDEHTVVAAVTDPHTGVVTSSGWDGPLPAPRLEGRRAVYEEVGPGIDLVVEATSTGFEEFFILQDAAAAQALADTGLSLAAPGAQIEELPGETLAVTDESGRAVASSGTPLMWDAAADEGRHFPLTAERPAEATGGRALSPMPDFDSPDEPTADTASDTASVESADPAQGEPALVADPMAAAVVVERAVEVTGDVAEVSLAPGEEFLTDPDTQFPVVIDPSVSITVGFDTYVKKGSTTDWSTATELLVGTWDGGANVARSFVQFNTTALAGKAVTAARLELYAFHSYSCTPKNWEVWHTGSVGTSTRWAAQPTWHSKQVTSSTTAGYGSACPDAWAQANVRGIVAAAAENSDARLTLGVRAESETDSYGWKRFYSADNGTKIPTLWVSYNSYPSKPTDVWHAAGEFFRGPDPATGETTLYSTVPSPGFSGVVTDPDGGNVRTAYDVRLDSSTTVWNKVLGTSVASGHRSTFTPTTSTPALGNSKTYNARAWGYDGSLYSVNPTSWWSFTTDFTNPTKPTVTSTGYTAGQWRESAPASNTFEFRSPATDVMRFEYKRNGAATWSSVPATTVSGSTTRRGTLSWNPGKGSHTITVRAIDKANRASTSTTFNFGSGGGAALSSPASGAKSTDTFTIRAESPPATSGTVTPSVYWRPAGTANASGWNPTFGSTSEWNLAKTLAATTAGSPVNVTTSFSAAAAAIDMGQTRTPALIDVQVCFTYSATGATLCTWTGNDTQDPSHTSVLRVPHAFGDAFPEADAGPGTVALWTGEFTTSATDVSVPTPKDTLSISRTYASFTGPAVSPASGVFGPGWAANLDGSDFGAAGYEVVDSTGIDGTIALVDGDGQALVYRQPGGTAVAGKTGVYLPVDEETAAEGARLELKAATPRELSLTEDDGTVTTWVPGPTIGGYATWVAEKIRQAGNIGSTTFTRDNKHRITRILAPAPDGVTCSGTLVRGCRALRLEYAATTKATAATPGDYTDRLVGVYYEAYNPDKAGVAVMDSVQVAAYTYTAQGYLATATDPRSNLTTAYSYNAVPSGLSAPQLKQVTPPGLAAWHLNYAATPQGTHGLTKVSRVPATGTGTPVAQAAFVYNVPTSGTDLPTLDTDTVGTWDQPAAPTWAAAVFDADHAAAITSPAGAGVADWRHADLQYTDAEGRVVNTASYGAGDWQISATDYDTEGRVIRTLDEGAIAHIRDVLAKGGSPNANSYATITRYNADITAPAAITHTGGTIPAGTVLTPAGTLVTDVWEPASQAGPGGELVRVHTHTDYDQGAPNSGVNPATGVAYRLPTTVTTTIAAPDSGSSDPADALPTGEEVTAQVKTGYDPIDNTSATGPTSGWTLGMATTTTTVMGQGQSDITARTAYNSAGQTVQTRQPKSTGTDAGTTNQIYYTAVANPADAACGNRPEYAGLPCATRTGESTPTIATTRTTNYTLYLAPRTVTETLGTAVRTTTTTYTDDGRISTAATTTSGVPGSSAVPASKTEYAERTGLPTAAVALKNGAETGRITTGYDAWGRATTYTDTDGQTTTTTYTATGDVQTINDPTGTIAYTYNGVDADGRPEFRGLATAMSITNADQPSLRLTAAYDAGGSLTRQALPGGIEQSYTYDRAGQLTDLTYTGEGADGRFEWFAFSLTRDADGDIIGDTAPGRARTFTIDRADRLTRVTDTIDTVDDTSTCTTRGYTFDANGNRTTATTATGEPGQDCTTQGAASRTWAHDAADRTLFGASGTGNYVYDALGRQTTLPGVDTPGGQATGNLQVGYYDTDLVRSTTQNGATTTYQLDPAGRRSTSTHTTGTAATTTVRHYGDTSDNPAWATTTTPTGTETSRYLPGLAGGMTLEITGSAPAIVVTDPLGTTSTTIPVPTPASSYASTSATWQRTDEYGNPLDARLSVTGALHYGWHGKDERATDTTGLTLMGVRLYNPVTGLFTSRDPVAGGNTTAYAYPQDPINNLDLDGEKRRPRGISKRPTSWQRHRGAILTVGTIAACVVASAFVCAGIGIGAAFVSNSRVRRGRLSVNWRGFANDAAWAVAGGAAGRAVSGSLRASAIARYRRPAPRHHARHDPRGTVTRVNWRQSRRNMGNNLGLAMWGTVGANITRPRR